MAILLTHTTRIMIIAKMFWIKHVLIELSRLLKQINCIGVWFGMQCGTFTSARRYDGKGPKPFVIVNTFLVFRTLLDATSCVYILQMARQLHVRLVSIMFEVRYQFLHWENHAAVYYALCSTLTSLLPYVVFKKCVSTIASLVHYGKSRILCWSLAIPILSGMNQYVPLIAKMINFQIVAYFMFVYRAMIKILMVNVISVLQT